MSEEYTEENCMKKVSMQEFIDFQTKVYYRVGEIMDRIETIEKYLRIKLPQRGVLGETLMEEGVDIDKFLRDQDEIKEDRIIGSLYTFDKRIDTK